MLTNCNFIGRFFYEDGIPTFAWSSTRIEFGFSGTKLVLDMESLSEEIFFNLYLDDTFHSVFSVPRGRHTLSVLDGVDVENSVVAIERRNELFLGLSKFYGVESSSSSRTFPIEREERLYIEFIGDSLTAGYGVESKGIDEPFKGETENSQKSYAGVACNWLKADFSIVAFSGKGAYRDYLGSTIKNLGFYYPLVSENPKVKWSFGGPRPDLVIINLGANDFAKGAPEKKAFIDSYIKLVDLVVKGYDNPRFLIIGGMEQTPEHIETNRSYIEEISRKLTYKGVDVSTMFIPPKDPELPRGADDHPGEEQQKIYGKIVSEKVKALNLNYNS